MVNYQPAALDRTFQALADPTRRALLAELEAHDGRSVSELARPFPMSLPAIMKHLDVLSDAGLVKRRKTGRTVTVQLSAGPMEDAMSWLERYRRYWTDQLDRLAAYVEEDASPCPTSPVSPSPAASTRRRKKYTKPGRSRKK